MRRFIPILVCLRALPGCLPDPERSLEAYAEQVARERDAAPDGAAPDAAADAVAEGPDGAAPADQGTADAFDRPPPVCSEGGGDAIVVAFNNRYEEKSIGVFWVDGVCDEREYAVLRPGETHIQNTYVLHAWRLRDHATGALILDWRAELGTQGPARVTVP